ISISSSNQHLKKIGQINFDYLPDTPTNHGWHLGIENEANLAPKFSSATDGSMAGCLKTRSNGRYYLDYDVEPSGKLCDIVELSTRFRRDSKIYLRIKVSTRDAKHGREVWLAQSIGNR